MLFNFEYSNDNCLKFVNDYFQIWSSKLDPSLSLTRRIILFKKHILTMSSISANHLISILRFLNTIVRRIYLSKKYSKKWLAFHINKKQPINTSDLELNSIDSTSNNYINYIDYDRRKHYLFSINDFTSLIHTNLENCYTYDIVPLPLEMKNPYTNKPFTKDELIDLNRQYSSMTSIPLIWHMFINCYYDLDRFKAVHNDYLLEKCIPSFVDKLEDGDIRFYLCDILQFLKDEKKPYCIQCMGEKKYFRSKRVRKLLIYWVKTLKEGSDVEKSIVEDIFKIYDVNCSVHNLIEKCISPVHKKKCDTTNQTVKTIDIPIIDSKPFYIDFSYPLVFSMGTYTPENRRRYKDKRRKKMKLKKRGKVKNI